MRDTPPALAAALNRDGGTLALCWRVVRADGVALGFTSHDRSLEIDGLRYSPAPGMSPSAVESGGAGGGEVAGALGGEAVREADLLAGRYDGAAATLLLVDWSDPAAGTMVLSAGRIGDVELADGGFVAALRTPLADLEASPIEQYSPECRAVLGDARCAVDLARHTALAVVANPGDGRIVTLGAAGAALGAGDVLRHGRLRVLTGAAAGEERPIAGSSSGEVRVDEAIAGLAAGDRLELREGCDKRFATCRDRFANAINFQGEPHVPGADAVFRYGLL